MSIPPLVPILVGLALLVLPGAAAGSPCVAAIAAAEAAEAIPPRLLAAIGQVESGRRDPATGVAAPWPWTINAEGQGSFFPDRAAAIAAVRALQARGVRSIDVGCMQVNLRHHPEAFASLEAAFDPVTNARYAARFLRELHAPRGDWTQAAAAYHSQTPAHAEPYRAKVMAAWRQPPPASAPRPTAPVLPSGLVGGMALSNQAERARVLPREGTGGRGLDAYRGAPIALAGRVGVAPGRL